ncbi:MAG TPA: MarR family transcriptional regulator [Syntrophorhabdaceae bacterium]|nr:MarR family transcriptional regulator [Syntrophorhabdaceae bacterium]
MKPGGVIAAISLIRSLSHEFIARELKGSGTADIAPSHGDILHTLYLTDGVPMKEIARGIRKKKNTVTVLTDKLVTLGYVRKEDDTTDKRSTRIFLTEKGRALETTFREVSSKLIRRTYRGFSRAEQDILMAFLERIENNLR